VKRSLKEARDKCTPERKEKDSGQISDMVLSVENAVKIILHISRFVVSLTRAISG
jgi:hypothetical protein